MKRDVGNMQMGWMKLLAKFEENCMEYYATSLGMG